MCGDLSKENSDLKKEIKVLKFKVTRLNNKIVKNQKQWAETLQELQQESHQHDLQQDCGKSFFTQFQGGEPYKRRLQPKKKKTILSTTETVQLHLDITIKWWHKFLFIVLSGKEIKYFLSM